MSEQIIVQDNTLIFFPIEELFLCKTVVSNNNSYNINSIAMFCCALSRIYASVSIEVVSLQFLFPFSLTFLFARKIPIWENLFERFIRHLMLMLRFWLTWGNSMVLIPKKLFAKLDFDVFILKFAIKDFLKHPTCERKKKSFTLQKKVS